MPAAVSPTQASVTSIAPRKYTEKGISLPDAGMPFGAFGADQIRNPAETDITEIVKMIKRDGRARGLYRCIVLPILAAVKNAQVKEVEGDKGEAEFAKNMLFLPPQAGGMTSSFNMTMRRLLTSTIYGFSTFEVVQNQPTVGPNAGKWVIGKLAPRPQETVTFRVDESGGFNGFHQKTSFRGRVIDEDIELENAFYFAVNEEENPFYGVSMFEPAFFHYDKKVKLYYIAHLAAQIAAVGVRAGSIPAGAQDEDVRQFKAALAQFAFNTSITIPADFKVEMLKAAGDTALFDKLFTHHNEMMSQSLLANFMDDQGRSVLIDNSSNAVAADAFVTAEESLLEQIAETITNHLLPRWIGYNFNNPAFPEFDFGPLTDQTREITVELYKTLAATEHSPRVLHELEKKVAADLELDVTPEEMDEEFEKSQKEAEEQKALIKKQMEEGALQPEKQDNGQPIPLKKRAAGAAADQAKAAANRAEVIAATYPFLPSEETTGLSIPISEILPEVRKLLDEWADGQPNAGS